MELNDLLRSREIAPERVLVLRHRPREPKLWERFKWLAANRPALFNAYQQTQTLRVEKAMESLRSAATSGAAYVASFIAHGPRNALYVGLYEIGGSRKLTREEFWNVPQYRELRKKYDLVGLTRDSCLWFDLAITDFCAGWKGKLIIEWPGKAISWWRRAQNNRFPIYAILEESDLEPPMPDWRALSLTSAELEDLPKSWQVALKEWSGVYYIRDVSDGKGYVGAAYGKDNLLGRWRNYARTGHGGNRLLHDRDRVNFQFSILELGPSDWDEREAQALETTWKIRLHTRSPDGLNDN